MKKRIIASLLTASMLAAALAGCGGSTAQTADTSADAAGEAESAQGDPATVTEKETNVSATADADLSGTTITFWHSMSGVNGEALTALVDRSMRRTPMALRWMRSLRASTMMRSTN